MTTMNPETGIKIANHNQTVVRPRPVVIVAGFDPGLATNHNQTLILPDVISPNHNQTLVLPGLISPNHNQTLVRR